MSQAEQVASLLSGELAILPTDTVYGIACAAALPAAVERLYTVKERPPTQPTAIMLGSVESLLSDVLPEARDRFGVLLASVLPGPITLVIPNPSRRFAQVCGDDPTRIGVRVPRLTAGVAALADAVGGLAATSANLRGGPAPAAFDHVPAELLQTAAIAIDGGTLPGAASAVIDVTGDQPVVLRDGPGVEAVLAAVR